MRKLAVLCVAAVLYAPAASAKPIPIHFIYAKADGTYQQFQSDRDLCAANAKRPHYWPSNDGHWGVDDWPSSTVFLTCMRDKGYVLAKEGWDTGVMWTLPHLRRPR